MNEQVWLPLDTDGSTVEVALLQNYAWWFWVSSASSSVTTSYAFSATRN